MDLYKYLVKKINQLYNLPDDWNGKNSKLLSENIKNQGIIFAKILSNLNIATVFPTLVDGLLIFEIYNENNDEMILTISEEGYDFFTSKNDVDIIFSEYIFENHNFQPAMDELSKLFPNDRN